MKQRLKAIEMRASILMVLMAVVSGNSMAQIGNPLSTLPATMPEPSNLAEAAGRYIGKRP
jgi:hypothetical protein